MVSMKEFHVFPAVCLSSAGNAIVVVPQGCVTAPHHVQHVQQYLSKEYAFDQLMTLDTPMGIWNVDGSMAQACGNGSRCVTALGAFLLRDSSRQSLMLHAPSGAQVGYVLPTPWDPLPYHSHNDAENAILGRTLRNANPRLFAAFDLFAKHLYVALRQGSAQVGITLPGESVSQDQCPWSFIYHRQRVSVLLRPLVYDVHTSEDTNEDKHRTAWASIVHVGNPHLLVWHPAPLDLDFLQTQEHLTPLFPQGVNISFAWQGAGGIHTCATPLPFPQESHKGSTYTTWNLVTWERGVGLTKACASAASALYAALYLWTMRDAQKKWTPGAFLAAQEGVHTVCKTSDHPLYLTVCTPGGALYLLPDALGIVHASHVRFHHHAYVPSCDMAEGDGALSCTTV